MNSLAPKLKTVEQRLSKKKGGFWTFALLQREDSGGKWDLLVSATWLQEGDRQSLEYIIAALEQEFDREDFHQLSRIVVLNPDNPVVQELSLAFSQEHRPTFIQSTTVNGMQFAQGIIITSRRPQADLAAAP